MSEKRTVLVIEDNPQNLEMVEYLLEEADMVVRKACDANEARTHLEAEVPDLILMDIQLPGCDGLSLVADFRRNPRFTSVPIIALTAHAMRGDKERFLAGGCSGYIAKPINTATFVKEVEEHLMADHSRRRKSPDGP